MNLQMNVGVAENYSSKSQIARVVTEDWFLNSGFCPSCDNSLTSINNNAKVHDFSCKICTAQFELKSFLGKTPAKINDGAYHSGPSHKIRQPSPQYFGNTPPQNRQG